jgi:hypothetical protein
VLPIGSTGWSGFEESVTYGIYGQILIKAKLEV